MLWSWLSNVMPPSSSLLTFIVSSFFVILKLQGLQRQVLPLGLISISFLSCNLPLHKGQSKVMYLLVGFCSLLKSTVVGSSSDSSKSSGIGFLKFMLLCYKACTNYFPVLLCTTKLAQSTFQYYFALQSLRKVEEKQRLDAGKRARFCSFLHRPGDARGKAETRDETRWRSNTSEAWQLPP